MHVTTRWNLAATILDGMVAGWVLMLGPAVAMVLGVAVGLVSAAGAEMANIGYAVFGVMLFPVLMWTSLPRFIVGLWMVWVMFRYWLHGERRLERLYALMGLSAMMVWATFGSESLGPGAAVTAVVLAGGYIAFRIWPGWNIRRLEEEVDKEIAERRQERRAQIQGQALNQVDPSSPIMPEACQPGTRSAPDSSSSDSVPPHPRGLGLLEMGDPSKD